MKQAAILQSATSESLEQLQLLFKTVEDGNLKGTVIGECSIRPDLLSKRPEVSSMGCLAFRRMRNELLVALIPSVLFIFLIAGVGFLSMTSALAMLLGELAAMIIALSVIFRVSQFLAEATSINNRA